MKKIIFIIISGILFNLSLNAQQSGEHFYYYQGEKIFLQQRTDKIYLKFAPNADKERIRTLIGGDTALQPTSDVNLDNRFNKFAIFEVKDGEKISPVTIEYYKARTDVISTAPLYEYRGVFQTLTDEFVVKLKQTTFYTQLQKLAEKNNCKAGEENEFVKNQFKVNVLKTSNLNAMQMSNLFYETGLFDFSQPNFVYLDIFNSIDPYFGDQWGLKKIGPTEQYGESDTMDIKIESAWRITEGIPNIKVALVDQGVEFDHPDLEGNLLPGYDTSGNSSGGAPVWNDDIHGTACAGIIGAIKDNGEGIAGVAPGCKIIPIHVALESVQLAGAINWAWQNGADVISNSWSGASPDALITSAIDSAVRFGRNGKGCVIVFSSGNFVSMWDFYNTYGVSFPANLSNVIAVGGVDRCGVRSGRIDIVPESCDPWCPTCSPGSCYGSELDVMAPGTNVLTTDRQGDMGYNTTLQSDHPDLDYTWFGGTSAACPHVAGVAALILSVNPGLKWYEVKNIIKHTAQKIRSDLYTYTNVIPEHTDGLWNEQMGYGLVNAYAAVLAACTVDLKYESIDSTLTVEGCVVNVDNVTLGSSADVTISGSRRVEITSLQMEDGSSLVVNNGVAATQSSASPLMASRAVTEESLVEAAENVEESTINTTPGNGRARLYQNRPNPFTGKTTIGYYLPKDSGPARLRITDMNGITVKTVGITASGEGTVVLDADALPKGIYLYSLIINGRVAETRRMVLE